MWGERACRSSVRMPAAFARRAAVCSAKWQRARARATELQRRIRLVTCSVCARCRWLAAATACAACARHLAKASALKSATRTRCSA